MAVAIFYGHFPNGQLAIHHLGGNTAYCIGWGMISDCRYSYAPALYRIAFDLLDPEKFKLLKEKYPIEGDVDYVVGDLNGHADDNTLRLIAEEFWKKEDLRSKIQYLTCDCNQTIRDNNAAFRDRYRIRLTSCVSGGVVNEMIQTFLETGVPW